MSEPEELDASLMASLVIAEIAAWNAIERALSASRVPLSYGRYLVLLTITGALGRARIQDVATSQRITVGAASRLVDRLCADGLVQRHPSPADRRVALLSVTDEGGAQAQGRPGGRRGRDAPRLLAPGSRPARLAVGDAHESHSHRGGHPMIRFDAVSKTYPGGTVAVEDFSLRIPERTTTVFLGTSGCGKTTLMRMVNAMVAPTSGRVLVRGKDVAEQDPVALRRSIGYVLQEGGLFPHRTIADNIATVPLLEGAPRRQARARALELMDLVGLDRGMAGRYPAQLSGGQRQRVGVARALANEADILLMDEPFGALDPLVRADLQAELIRIREQLGTTILFVTHDIDEAFLLGDQIAVLRTGGRVAQVGTAQELLSHPADDFVADFVGASRAARPVRIDHRRGGLVVDEAGTPVGTLREPDRGARP